MESFIALRSIITICVQGHNVTKKEALSNTGAEHPKTNGSLLDGGASFTINIPSATFFSSVFSIVIVLFLSGLAGVTDPDYD